MVNFFLCVENEGTVLNNFLVEREAGDEDCKKSPLARVHAKSMP